MQTAQTQIRTEKAAGRRARREREREGGRGRERERERLDRRLLSNLAAQHEAREVQRDVVPLVRAVWFAKVTILKEFIEKDKSEVSA